jgi:hypothetical protein
MCKHHTILACVILYTKQVSTFHPSKLMQCGLLQHLVDGNEFFNWRITSHQLLVDMHVQYIRLLFYYTRSTHSHIPNKWKINISYMLIWSKLMIEANIVLLIFSLTIFIFFLKKLRSDCLIIRNLNE